MHHSQRILRRRQEGLAPAALPARMTPSRTEGQMQAGKLAVQIYWSKHGAYLSRQKCEEGFADFIFTRGSRVEPNGNA